MRWWDIQPVMAVERELFDDEAWSETMFWSELAQRDTRQLHIEKIVQRLEGEELPLDESLRLFEEGIALSRFCHKKLEEVEKRIEMILSDSKGEPGIEPFGEDERDQPAEAGS